MVKFNGTEGKWKFIINTKPKRTRIEVRAYPYNNRPDFGILMHEYVLDDEQCSVEGCGCIIEEVANAKLIAAAPELLEALLEAKELIGNFRIKNEVPTQETWKKIELVIKKATE